MLVSIQRRMGSRKSKRRGLKGRKWPRSRPHCEQLEERCLLDCSFQDLFYRTIDGTCNNLFFTRWGSAGVDELRKAPVAYADGISAPAVRGPASTRFISNAAADNPPPDVNSARFLSDYAYVWGQFIDHDIDLTTDGTGSQLQPLNIPVPTCDPQFDPPDPVTGECTGTAIIPFNRSEFDPATGTSRSNPRQHANEITAFIDGSMIYGSDDTRASLLRTHEGGHLKTSPGNMLPLNNSTYFGAAAPLRNANDAQIVPDDQLFVAGDIRANENIELTNIHTLFLREHNRVADVFHGLHPAWTDNQLYLEARRFVGAEIQAITYQEWLPALLGNNALRPYDGYNPFVNPGIANEFATAGFRLGHSMLSGTIDRMDENGNELPDGHGNLHLQDAFFNPIYLNASQDPSNLVGDDVDAVAKGNASDLSQEIDLRVIDDVRNFLFVGPPHPFGLDLPAINMQRGRDHGLPDYNALRAAYGLLRVHNYAEINPDPDVIARLTAAYGPNNVNNIDPWLGGLAEAHVPGTSTGPLIRRVLVDQFTRLRDGDRFFYLNDYAPNELAHLRSQGLDLLGTTLAKVIEHNTQLTNIQDNVFFFKLLIGGQVFQDLNGIDVPMPGVTVQLFDDSGTLQGTTQTDVNGQYQLTNFDGLALGTFQVREVVPDGFIQETHDPDDITFTRGNVTVDGVDFGNLLLGGSLSPGGGGLGISLQQLQISRVTNQPATEQVTSVSPAVALNANLPAIANDWIQTNGSVPARTVSTLGAATDSGATTLDHAAPADILARDALFTLT
jgi:hypothetical protein